MMELWELNAHEVARQIEAGDLTAEALMRATLARIADREAEVQAWCHLDPEEALAAARALDKGSRRGLLHGLPIGFKDIFDTADMPTGYGSPIYAGHRPAWDCTPVALTRAAGGIVVGKTVTTEFAYFHPGKTQNPHDSSHTPGGSSSGSAAAVGADMVSLATGSQTVGSVIRPASFCGVVGYKPTYGLVDMTGVKPFARSLDTCGLFARSVADAALFGRVLTNRELGEGKAPETAPCLKFCRGPTWAEARPEGIAALEEAHRRLGRPGDLALPADFDDLPEAQATIQFKEASASYFFEASTQADKLSDVLKAMLREGWAIPPERYDAAQRLARRCRGLLAEVFSKADTLITLSAPGEAPKGLATTGNPAFNKIWTLLGVPCISVPGLIGPRGLPIGIQVIGPLMSDAQTLRAAAWVESRLR
jgi:Asp-tRNA(Asn)/Glu-tRNA(Gln) amidotransferase A subunit family amidase